MRKAQSVSLTPYIRIERVLNGGSSSASVATKDRYIYVGEDGSETEISSIMRGVKLSAMYGEVWTATFETPFIRLVEVPE